MHVHQTVLYMHLIMYYDYDYFNHSHLFSEYISVQFTLIPLNYNSILAPFLVFIRCLPLMNTLLFLCCISTVSQELEFLANFIFKVYS